MIFVDPAIMLPKPPKGVEQLKLIASQLKKIEIDKLSNFGYRDKTYMGRQVRKHFFDVAPLFEDMSHVLLYVDDVVVCSRPTSAPLFLEKVARQLKPVLYN